MKGLMERGIDEITRNIIKSNFLATSEGSSLLSLSDESSTFER